MAASRASIGPRLDKAGIAVALTTSRVVSSTPGGLGGTAPLAARELLLNGTERELAARINRVRHGRRLRALFVSKELSLAADAHARAMARGGYFSHTSSNGTPFWKRIARYYSRRGYSRWKVGETLFWSPSPSTPGAIELAWLRSREHARILLGAWTQVGIAIVHANDAPGLFGGRDVVIAVADFGSRTR